jgi:hypothetical protein
MNPACNPYLFDVILSQNSRMVPSLQVYRLKLYTHLTPFDLIIQIHVMFGEEYNFFKSLIPVVLIHLLFVLSSIVLRNSSCYSLGIHNTFSRPYKPKCYCFSLSSHLSYTEHLTCILKTPGSNLDRHFSSPEVSIVFLTRFSRISGPLFK